MNTSEQIQVQEYLRIYDIFVNLKFHGDSSDIYQVIQYKILCRHTYERLIEIYRNLPVCVKDSALVPKVTKF
jgi:hypothetical protein